MSLLAPAFLLGLLAVGLPWWLHRLSSDNPNKQKFSSLMFLEPGEPRRVLAKKVQYLLLLALRIGVLVLLALAFTEPAIWRTPEAGGDADGARLHLIVLDGSASMGYGDRWDSARAAANDVLDRSAQRGSRADRARGPVVRGARAGDGRRRRAAADAEHGRARACSGSSTGSSCARSTACCARPSCPSCSISSPTCRRRGLPTRFGELAPRRPAEIVDPRRQATARPRTGPSTASAPRR